MHQSLASQYWRSHEGEQQGSLPHFSGRELCRAVSNASLGVVLTSDAAAFSSPPWSASIRTSSIRVDASGIVCAVASGETVRGIPSDRTHCKYSQQPSDEDREVNSGLSQCPREKTLPPGGFFSSKTETETFVYS